MQTSFIKGLSIDWNAVAADSYLHRITGLRRIHSLALPGAVTFLVGENGTGKSTLLEAIAVAYGFNPEGGTLNYRFSTFEDVSPLSAAVRLVRGPKRARDCFFFRAESFFNVASKAEDYRMGDAKEVFYARYGGRALHEQSHGESFLAWFQSLRGDGLYLMDEPEAALSPQRQLTLLLQIHEMARQGAQFIIATHSPILLGLPEGQILNFSETGVAPCRYEDTDSYIITKMFVNDRQAMLRHLLEEE